MVTDMPGIRYPERAEFIDKSPRLYANYKVFTEFWDSLTTEMAPRVRTLATNDSVTILGVHGPQGAGKSLFQQRLLADHSDAVEATKKELTIRQDDNVWQQIVAKQSADLDWQVKITQEVSLQRVPNERRKEWFSWIATLADIDKKSVILFDNAERADFLVGAGILNTRGPEDRLGRLTEAAENIVEQVRTKFNHTLIILLSNNLTFLEGLRDAIDTQQKGLMSITELPLPTTNEKEQAVRVNTNRLNPVSYWACVDRAEPARRSTLEESLAGADTFPTVFKAVDQALSSWAGARRPGRPGRRHQLTFVLISNHQSFTTASDGNVLQVDHAPEVEASIDWLHSEFYDRDWAHRIMPDKRAAALLESEWCLRLVRIGNPFLSRLLLVAADGSGQDADWCRRLLTELHTPLGPTFPSSSKSDFTRRLTRIISAPPKTQGADLALFWAAGQARTYETYLKTIFPAYDRSTPTWGGKRPDLIASDYHSFSVLPGVRHTLRDAHCFEFTAQQNPSAVSVRNYLGGKLENYVRVLEIN